MFFDMSIQQNVERCNDLKIHLFFPEEYSNQLDQDEIIEFLV
jgi:hypothetical protein